LEISSLESLSEISFAFIELEMSRQMTSSKFSVVPDDFLLPKAGNAIAMIRKAIAFLKKK
jgi:hypothetical protein